MKKLMMLILMLLVIPTMGFAEAGDHDRAERLKDLYNKVYPKTKTVNSGYTTLRRYKDSRVYYNQNKYPTGPPQYVKDVGNYQLYKREIRIIRPQNRCRKNYYK